jgi:23S rRNA (guanine745-N1)-methyltransferase
MSREGSIRKIKFQENINMFRCPICRTKMDICDSKDMACFNRHCFNIARKGYINFLLKSIKTEYDKEMFHSRNLVCASGLFNPMLECISHLVIGRIGKHNLKNIKILDAGCGEGSHLGQVVDSLRSNTSNNMDIQGVGIDISKEGILMASKAHFDIIWCVADLANLPFTDKQFDVILNILSPANYEEFNRVLKDEGIFIKVVPGSNYLKELRDIFYDGTDRQTYSNDKVIQLYRNNFNILSKQDILYSRAIDKKELIHVIRMTPLSWRITDQTIKKVFDMKIDNVTLDFTVIMGEKTHN